MPPLSSTCRVGWKLYPRSPKASAGGTFTLLMPPAVGTSVTQHMLHRALGQDDSDSKLGLGLEASTPSPHSRHLHLEVHNGLMPFAVGSCL